MFTYVRETNVGEYLRRVDDIYPHHNRLDIIAEFWKENELYYQNVLLLALDLFRQNDGHSENHEAVFAEFSDYYTHAMSSRLQALIRLISTDPSETALFVIQYSNIPAGKV